MKDDRIYLLHIRDAIRHIEYTAAGQADFLVDRKTQDAKGLLATLGHNP